MPNSDTRFIYTDDDGLVCIVCPSDKTTLTLDEIKAKEFQEKKGKSPNRSRLQELAGIKTNKNKNK